MLVYVLAFLTSCFKSKFSSGVRNAGLVLLHCLFFPVLWQAFQTFRVIPTPISGKDASTTYILADDGVTVVASSPEYTVSNATPHCKGITNLVVQALVVITLFLVGMAVGLAGYLALSLWQRRRLQQQQSAHFMNIPEYLVRRSAVPSFFLSTFHLPPTASRPSWQSSCIVEYIKNAEVCTRHGCDFLSPE